MSMDDGSCIGVDFGGTSIKAARIQGSQIVESVSLDTPAGASPSTVLDTIARAVAEFGAAPPTLGLAIPGEVDAEGRCWRLPNVPGFEGVSIAEELKRRTGSRVTVDNDGTAAALGEALFGHGRSYSSFAMVLLGTGVGGGLVLNGRPRRGANGFAAEIGHIPIDLSPNAWPCACGQSGCVEAYAGTRGLLRRFEELGGGSAERVATIADSARAGGPGAQVFHEMAEALAICVTTIQNLLDLDAIVFAGGVSQSFDLLERPLRTALERRAFSAPQGAVPLVVSQLGASAGMVGAAHLPAHELG